jgi:solute carrier family 25 carnitine/acylcarnitine transporter 20/29
MAARTSLVGSGGATTEGYAGVVCGTLFGLTSPLVGHPIDTLKTLQQTTYRAGGSAIATLAHVVRTEGLLALYRGLLPPLLGSSVFRSVQFSVYGACMGAARDSPALTSTIPDAGGLQWRVLGAGVIASTARALIETPLEFVKVRRQTNQPWLASGSLGGALRAPLREARLLYTGFGVSWLRTVGLMTSFFIQVDHLERHHRSIVDTPLLGPFVKGGVAATTAWVVIWPFETLKSQVQAGTFRGVPELERAGWLARARYLVRQQGYAALYRGIGPGLTRSMVANGSSMVVYAQCCEAMRGP